MLNSGRDQPLLAPCTRTVVGCGLWRSSVPQTHPGCHAATLQIATTLEYPTAKSLTALSGGV